MPTAGLQTESRLLFRPIAQARPARLRAPAFHIALSLRRGLRPADGLWVKPARPGRPPAGVSSRQADRAISRSRASCSAGAEFSRRAETSPDLPFGTCVRRLGKARPET